MKLLSTVLCLLQCTFIVAALDLADYAPVGHVLIRHNYYILEFNQQARTPNFVIYAIGRQNCVQRATRQGMYFKRDPMVSNSAQNSDYYGRGYDRGHMCPAQDMQFSEQAMRQTFLYTNACPQLPEFNRGVWKTLETHIRKQAYTRSMVVLTGSVHTATQPRIGSGIAVPYAFYKIVYYVDQSSMRCYYLKHQNYQAGVQVTSFVVPVQLLQALTKRKFKRFKSEESFIYGKVWSIDGSIQSRVWLPQTDKKLEQGETIGVQRSKGVLGFRTLREFLEDDK